MTPLLGSLGGGSIKGFRPSVAGILPLAVPTNFSVTQANTATVANVLTWTNSNITDQTRIIIDSPSGLTSVYVGPGVSSYTHTVSPDTYYGYAIAHYRSGITGPQTSYSYLYSRPKTIKFYFIQSADPAQTTSLYMYWGIQWPDNANTQNYTINIYRDGSNIANYVYSSYTYSLTNSGLSAGSVYTYGIQITNNITGVSSYRWLQQAKTRPSTGIITQVSWGGPGYPTVVLPQDSCHVQAYAYVSNLTNVPSNWEIRGTTYNSSTREVISYTVIPKTISPNSYPYGTLTSTYAGMCQYEGCSNDYSGMYEIAVFNEYGTKMTYGIEQGGSNGSPYDFYYGC